MKRDYETSPVADDLELREVVLGLADDLAALRASEISVHDALARAAIAKQIFNGVRLYLQAAHYIEMRAKQLSPQLENAGTKRRKAAK